MSPDSTSENGSFDLAPDFKENVELIFLDGLDGGGNGDELIPEAVESVLDLRLDMLMTVLGFGLEKDEIPEGDWEKISPRLKCLGVD